MNLENNLNWPKKEEMAFYVASGAYIITGLVDGLLTVNGLQSNISREFSPLTNFLINYYGIGTGVAITKSNALMALMASEIVQRRSDSPSEKNLVHYLLYGGATLSLVGIIGWLEWISILR